MSNLLHLYSPALRRKELKSVKCMMLLANETIGIGAGDVCKWRRQGITDSNRIAMLNSNGDIKESAEIDKYFGNIDSLDASGRMAVPLNRALEWIAGKSIQSQ